MHTATILRSPCFLGPYHLYMPHFHPTTVLFPAKKLREKKKEQLLVHEDKITSMVKKGMRLVLMEELMGRVRSRDFAKES